MLIKRQSRPELTLCTQGRRGSVRTAQRQLPGKYPRPLHDEKYFLIELDRCWAENCDRKTRSEKKSTGSIGGSVVSLSGAPALPASLTNNRPEMGQLWIISNQNARRYL